MNESQEGTGGVPPTPPTPPPGQPEETPAGPPQAPPTTGPAYAGPPPQGAPPGSQWVPRSRTSWDRKSVLLAVILSIPMPGLGQVYLGFYQRGFIQAIIFGATIVILASGAAHNMEPLFGIFLGFFYFYNLIDAGRRASYYNRALEGLEPFELPEDFKMPGPRGSLFGGIVLTLFGLILFMHTRFGFDLDWLAEWWPLVLVAFGLNLIYKATRKKDETA